MKPLSFWLEKHPSLSLVKSDIQTGRLAHAYLMAGGSDNIIEIVRTLAQSIQCPHKNTLTSCQKKCPVCFQIEKGAFVDFVQISPSGKAQTIKMEDILFVRHLIQTKPLVAQRRICFVEQADRLEKSAANAFLKILEEPPMGTILILSCDNLYSVLDTIVSRCRRVLLGGDILQQLIDPVYEERGKIREYLFDAFLSYQADRLFMIIDSIVDCVEHLSVSKKLSFKEERYDRYICEVLFLMLREISILQNHCHSDRFLIWIEKKAVFSQLADRVSPSVITNMISRVLEVRKNLQYHVPLKLMLVHLFNPIADMSA